MVIYVMSGLGSSRKASPGWIRTTNHVNQGVSPWLVQLSQELRLGVLSKNEFW